MKAWAKGDRVVQPTYGPGTLVEVNEHHTVIDFDEHGRRVFATRLVVLQATNEPAPAKAARKRAAKAKPKEAKAENCAYAPGRAAGADVSSDTNTSVTIVDTRGRHSGQRNISSDLMPPSRIGDFFLDITDRSSAQAIHSRLQMHRLLRCSRSPLQLEVSCVHLAFIVGSLDFS